MLKEKANIKINDIENKGVIYLDKNSLTIDFGISKKIIRLKQIKSISNNKNSLELLLKNNDIIVLNLKSKNELYENIKLNTLNKKNILKDFKNKRFMFIAIPIALLIVLSIFLISNTSTTLTDARQSVLKINVFDKNGETLQTGSGFVAFNKNILITNAHVITNGYSAEAINENNERVFIKGIIYYNQDEDIAILKLNNQNKIKPLKISTRYNVGDRVVAIGSPLGIKNSVSDGVISNIYDVENKSLIQHSAPISSGSSGGVLLDANNKVIGMNTASFINGQNINVAIPIKTIKKAYESSKNNEIKKINKIQLNDDEKIQSIMLNNNSGKQIIKLIKEETESRISIRNKINDLKTIPIYDEIYTVKDYFEQVLIVWGGDKIDCPTYTNEDGTIEEECYGNDVKLIEDSKMPEFVILKAYNLNSETYSLVKEIFMDRCSWLYSDIYEPESHFVGYKNTNSYYNSYKNATIGYYNNYIYMIAAKSDSFKEKLIKLIEQLP